MDTEELMLRFPGRCRLLLQSLLAGATGVPRALKVFGRQRSADPGFTPHRLLETLCQEEPCLAPGARTLVTKPLVCLFPTSFQWSLLSFLRLVHPLLPRDGLLCLVDCFTQDYSSPPWITALVGQLQRDLGVPGVEMLTPRCQQRVKDLCGRFNGAGGTRTWSSCLTGTRALNEAPLFDALQKKRKSQNLEPDPDAEDTGQQSKRLRPDLPVAAEDPDGGPEAPAPRPSDDAPEPEPKDALPEPLKAAVPLIRELLESDAEMDASVLEVLNECGPGQVEALCGLLGLSEAPEQALPRFCGRLLALPADLSHSVAAALVRHLLLDKVLSLAEPPSRCLISAASSLCSRYPRATCQALLGPVLEERQPESAQVELICRLVEGSLDPQYRLLLFHIALQGTWNEHLLSVILALLDTKLDLTDELLCLFTTQLRKQSAHFTKSMKFSKMLLTVLTKYQCSVRGEFKDALSACLSANETFLKKSLHAAFKRLN
ncbi:Fanconi anemia group E protein [Denticeps clupeoides]|uniref:Fanconi anemia group E protein n=1 Tax=Denticeps clupeoides TaxID=299321 RepID=UPI0010A42925|nr:Fanconi anemia group E protein [Denticeps clupeoides]